MKTIIHCTTYSVILCLLASALFAFLADAFNGPERGHWRRIRFARVFLWLAGISAAAGLVGSLLL